MQSCIRHARRHPCVCLSVCMLLRACIRSRVYGYECMSVLGMYICMYICLYVCLFMCMHVRACVRVSDVCPLLFL